jgi:hypothetical protein
MELPFVGLGWTDLAITLNRVPLGHSSCCRDIMVRIDDWLYLPETLYAFISFMVVSAGAGHK